MKSLTLLLALLIAAPLAAQPAPIVATTVRTTSTASNSVRIGCTETAVTCTGGVVAGPIDVASVSSAGFIGIANNVPSSTTFRLYNNAGTLTWNGVALATGSSLSGTLNTIPLFTGASSVGNSIVTQNVGATLITVTGDLTATGALTGTLATAVQPNVTTMAGLTSVGTITTGTWNGTIIALARGGTGADLSGTGGSSQFLRQNSVGGAITVVRPAISDLSDNSNLPLLNTSNIFTRAVATSNVIALVNTTSGSTAAAYVNIQAGTAQGYLVTHSQGFATNKSQIASGTRLVNTTGGGVTISSENAAGGIGFYTGAADTLRWGVNAAGDFTGAGSVLVDAVSTPTIAIGFGGGATIAGSVYAFRLTIVNPGATTGSIDFNRTFATAPICVASLGAFSSLGIISSDTTTLGVSISRSTAFAAGDTVNVICRGI